MITQVKQTEFTRKVIALITQIPRGRVATYGQIAKLAGKPGSARAVGWILHSCAKTHSLPWQRVLNSQGKISFKKGCSEFSKQRKLLSQEKIDVSVSGQLELSKYQWKKKVRANDSAPKMFS